MKRRSQEEIWTLAYLFGGGILLVYVLTYCAIGIILGFIGYKLFDIGLRRAGYPPISYWMSWLRAQFWR